jgi:hypothetical protein
MEPAAADRAGTGQSAPADGYLGPTRPELPGPVLLQEHVGGRKSAGSELGASAASDGTTRNSMPHSVAGVSGRSKA